MSFELVKKKFRPIFLVLSLDTYLTSEIPPGPSVGVFHEDGRSKYSETADCGSPELFRRTTDTVVGRPDDFFGSLFGHPFDI